MEQLVLSVIEFVIGLADKHQYIATFCLVIGALYLSLTALRGVLTAVVKLTKTDKDDKVVNAVYGFLDTFGFGFKKFAEYFESHKKEGK